MIATCLLIDERSILDIARAREALSRSDTTQLCIQLAPYFPNESATGRLQELVAYAVGESSAPPACNDVEQLFFESIAETRRILAGAPLPYAKRLSAGSELDFLCDRGGIETWGLAQLLNFLHLGRIQPKLRSAVVAAMRDDGIYVLQWIAHYLSLGFEHIFIYTNDNSDGSEDLLRALADNGVITLVESETAGDVQPESKAFGHALHLLHDFRDFDWVLFVDSDEYFVPGPEYGLSISRILDAVPANVSAVCYDWLWFVSGMAFERTPDLLIERFQHARPHHLTKCLGRVRDLVSMRRDHFAELADGCMQVDSLLQPIDLNRIYNKIPTYAGGTINHYWPKSFEEFAVKKSRGSTLQIEENLYDRPYDKFFIWNEEESGENHWPPSAELLSRTKDQILRLKCLPNVREAAELIEINFPYMLHLIAGDLQLRHIYQTSKTNPGPL